jgi:acetolactate synthase-1/2/3 large subunit
METSALKQREATAMSTAEDTLKRKSRDAAVISGVHLLTNAVKAQSADTIFTPRSGHLIDIYDGCLDEAIKIACVRHEQLAALAL